jgi:hypothetical protein
MKSYLIRILAAAILGHAGVCPAMAQDGGMPKQRAEAKALAERIDKLIYKRLEQANIKPGPKAEPAQLQRRLHLDLAGRIPSLLDTMDFLDPTNENPNKVEDLIDELLSSKRYAHNFANYWRSIMLAGSVDYQLLNWQAPFEAWLRERLEKNTGYNKIAYELLTVQSIYQEKPSPAGFYQVNERLAENLAAATARVFLGITLECSQCHKHPWAKWTGQQFRDLTAFYSGVPLPKNKNKSQPFDPDSRAIWIAEDGTIMKAKFFSGEKPPWQKNVPVRQTLAEWITSPKNPYFARATVDHLWQYFFTVSLTQPVLEPRPGSPPAHPELLDELANAFSTSGFDLKYLIRAIVMTDAYRRASVPVGEDSKLHIQMFAKMPVRGMTPEQLFDSLCQAIGYWDNYWDKQSNFQKLKTPRGQFLAQFPEHGKRIEPEVAVLQSLFPMNGKFIKHRCQMENSESLRTIAGQKTSTARKVETLYMIALSRLPRPEEMNVLVRVLDKNKSPQSVGDAFWDLLNSSEFTVIH